MSPKSSSPTIIHTWWRLWRLVKCRKYSWEATTTNKQVQNKTLENCQYNDECEAATTREFLKKCFEVLLMHMTMMIVEKYELWWYLKLLFPSLTLPLQPETWSSDWRRERMRRQWVICYTSLGIKILHLLLTSRISRIYLLCRTFF